MYFPLSGEAVCSGPFRLIKRLSGGSLAFRRAEREALHSDTRPAVASFSV